MSIVIYLTSKYTGEVTWLGAKYQTPEEAHEYIDKHVCRRCNSVHITGVKDDWHWISRTKGFGPVEDVMKHNAIKNKEEHWLRTGRTPAA